MTALIPLSKPATANSTEEWVEIGNSEAALDNSGPWRVKNVKRQGNIVIFESLSPESEYMKVEGKCSNRTWRVLFLGQYNNKGEIEYQSVLNHLWHWHKPEPRERKLLKYICSTNLNS